MKSCSKTVVAALCSGLLLGPALLTGGAFAAEEAVAPAAQSKPNWYPRRADVNFVKQYAVLPKPDGVTIVDARPAARKYDSGHIPTAANIPDLQFDKLAPTLLPVPAADLLLRRSGLHAQPLLSVQGREAGLHQRAGVCRGLSRLDPQRQPACRQRRTYQAADG